MEHTYKYIQLDICGAYSDAGPATEEIQQYCNEVKNQVEAKTNQKYVEFKAVTYKCRNVGVIDYIIEVQVNECDYIHVHLIQKFACNGGQIVFISVEENHKKGDPL